jgi:hypothetical protein
MKALLFALAICTLLLPAGAQTNTAVPVAGSTSTNLAHLIASADHIIVTNRLDKWEEARYRGFSLSISGDYARNIVRAMSFAKPTGNCRCVNEWDTKFYRETNFLADVQLGDGLFVFEEQWYEDDSGVLKRFYSELYKQMRTPPNTALEPTATAP